MKTNVKFLALAVVATALAFSCVKEEIAEENIKDNQDKTEVEITGQVFEAVMENTKSTLVDKTPTWAEEDVIALFGNGSESAVQLTYAGENKFQTAAGVTVEGPYYAIYPYDENHTVDQTTGIFTATVPAEQIIAQGQNVAAGALASVAYSEGTQLYFRNAVSLIRIENKREDIVSIKIESTNAEQKLAGTFTMDLNPDKETEGEAPAVTAVAETGIASITLKPAEENGMFAPGELYAAVLPTNLDGIKVTFERKGENENETATVTKTADVELKRNGGANLGSFFTYEISNADELLAWNKAAAKWTAWDVVTLTDNIDCKDVINSENWTPNEFTGTFDGNDKTIDNFVIELAGPAAFFGRTNGSAVVKDLTFGEGCSFTTTASTPVSSDDFYSNNRMYAASVVCEAKDKSTFSNIKNYGSVTATGTSASSGNYIAGIVASHESTATVSYCDNYGTVIFNTIPNSWVNLGGCFGQITKATTLEYCNNHGSVKFTGTNSNSSRLNMAGITGGANDVTFSNCKNLGTVEHNATASHAGQVNLGGFIGYNNAAVVKAFIECANGSSGTSQGALINNAETTGVLCMGGCIAYINGYNTSIDGFINYAPITNNKNSSNTIAMGGIVGQIQNASKNTIKNCENNGEISNNVALTGNLYMGGIVGMQNSANTNIEGVTNKGKISNSKAASSSKSIAVGGVVGYIKSGNNHSIIKAKNEGALIPYTGDSKAYASAGGIVGFIDSGNTIIGDETVNGVTNSGNIIWTGKGYDIGIGGIVGKICGNSSNTIQNCKNTGNSGHSTWLDDPQKQAHGWGGILGRHYCADETTPVTLNITNCTNEGSIAKTGGSVGHTHIGGIAGSLGATSYTATSTVTSPKLTDTFNSGKGTATISNCNNYGNLSNVWTTSGGNKHSYTGGIAGFFNYDGSLNGCINEGSITSNVYSTNGNLPMCLGGIVGRSAASTMTDCTNNGAVSELSASKTGCVGGIVGYILKTRPLTLTNCDNTKEIIGTFSTAGDFRVGGIVGMSHNSITMENCDNTGNVTSKTTQTANTQFIGGIIGQSEKNLAAIIKNCSCKATVTPSTTLSNAYSGMIGGRITDQNNPKISSVTGTTVSGTFNGTPLNSSNYTGFCFGSSSDFKVTTGITFAE